VSNEKYPPRKHKVFSLKTFSPSNELNIKPISSSLKISTKKKSASLNVCQIFYPESIAKRSLELKSNKITKKFNFLTFIIFFKMPLTKQIILIFNFFK